jgi:hypothetical protein
MTFEPEKVNTFLDNFNQHKKMIRNFSGCTYLELLRDKKQDNIYHTYSFWKSEEDLENYRNSDLFKSVWANTKILFADEPIAYSLERMEIV